MFLTAQSPGAFLSRSVAISTASLHHFLECSGSVAISTASSASFLGVKSFMTASFASFLGVQCFVHCYSATPLCKSPGAVSTRTASKDEPSRATACTRQPWAAKGKRLLKRLKRGFLFFAMFFCSKRLYSSHMPAIAMYRFGRETGIFLLGKHGFVLILECSGLPYPKKTKKKRNPRQYTCSKKGLLPFPCFFEVFWGPHKPDHS